MNKFRNISLRSFATFIASALSVIGAGSLIGVSVWQSGILAGVISVARVIESISRAYARGGRITYVDIDRAFGSVQEVEPPSSGDGDVCACCGK